MRYFLDGWTLQNLRGDIFGGITVAVVALPLALAFGVASGLGAEAGLHSAIIAGFLAAVFGGTRSQITGPTGPMTVVMAAVVASHANNMGEAFAIVALGGIIQVAMGMARVGRFVAYTPYSVISGFMTGIGVIIIILQLAPALGMPEGGSGPVGALATVLAAGPANMNASAAILAAVALGVTIFWPARFQTWMPSTLAALLVGSVLSVFLLPGVATIGEIPASLPSLTSLSVDMGSLGTVVQAGLVFALIASIDSLLTSVVADNVTRTEHNSSRELIGQGVGNIAAGMFGALPAAGATMRTLVNIRAGGRTPLSGVIHALVLLSLVLGLGQYAAFVPLPVLAGILLKIGWDVIDWGYVRRVHRIPRGKALVMLTTLGLTVFVDLISAVAIGFIMSAFLNAEALKDEQMRGVRHADASADDAELSETERNILKSARTAVLFTQFSGAFSYASARELVRRTGPRAIEHSALVYDFTGTTYMDPSAGMAVDALIEQAQQAGKAVFLSGLASGPRALFEGLGILDRIPQGRIFDARQEALQAAAAYVEAGD